MVKCEVLIFFIRRGANTELYKIQYYGRMNNLTVETLAEFRVLTSGIKNRHVDDWKAAGRPVTGYFCHYVPVEVLLAAGMLPLRLRGTGSDDSSSADAYMSSRVCTYVRHVMSLVLEGDYDFLDAEICLNTCDHVRRAADLFVKKTSIPFHGFISVPRSTRESLYGYYLGELKKLLSGLGEHFNTSAGKNELREAIVLMNGVRSRLAEINKLRMEERPKLTGAESLMVHIASQMMPPEAFCEVADRLLEELKDFEGHESPRARLILVGAELDEPEYVAVLESQGALVVADLLCFGARSVLPLIDENADDPLDAIGRAYFFRPSCARMIGDFPARWERMKELMSQAGADGAIFVRHMFCDPWGADQHNMMHRTSIEDGPPLLVLSREYGIVPTGQLKTRVQAFVERLEIMKARNSSPGSYD